MVNLKQIGEIILRTLITITLILFIKTTMFGQSTYNPFVLLKENDKQLHFSAGMVTSALGYTWSYNKHQDKKRAMITGLCTSLVAGITKELLDNIRGGDFDERDIFATTLGGVGMSVTIPLFQPKKKRNKY
tara:strand:- start:520 stop:912 length:393 start_codon:yes stop_codon:yes gene_type:complete